ncbi:transcriptional regulator PpsR [Thiohalocapsa sp. ML1]|uniref:transcriptional regulator PpsR n=1 Tax=Thiohalocapsa sp. ML1 TaxID=1431688 RepID=UPI000A6537CC|nr:transcriptional regulator PpsR [Thiohalocapsa sp. ML1]
MKPFDAPEAALGDIGSDFMAALLGAAADISIILDNEGTIRDLAYGSDELSSEIGDDWIGRRWADTVTAESRPRALSLLAEASPDPTAPQRQQVSHVSRSGAELPVRYFVARLDARHLIAVGHNLQGIAALQQRLVDAQQSLERDYWRLRQLETRYRLLFRSATDAIVILDPDSGKVVEANPAASLLLAADSRRLVGRAFPDGFDEAGTRAIQSLIAGVRAAGRANDVRARQRSGTEFQVSGAPVRQESASLILLRLSPVDAEGHKQAAAEPRSRLARMVEKAPDGIVLTGQDGRILSANTAFLDLAQLTTEDQARGESLDRWLGRPGVDLNVLIANLRQHGAVRLFATQVRSELGASSEVEISAVSIHNGEQPSFGFIIRNVDRRVSADGGGERALPSSIEHLTELVGRVPLKEVVRESTDMIERLCIEAALELTGDNRASAAELLGLSRQSLYVKLRRYGLSEPGVESD